MKIYLAKPISGCSADEVFGYYRQQIDQFREMGYEVLCPMTGKGYLRAELEFKAHGYGSPISTNQAILGRDEWMVKQCDVIYVNLMGAQRVSIGCVAELAFAKAYGKHSVIAMEADNIHQHAFVLAMAHIIFPATDEAVSYLGDLAKTYL